MPQILEHIWQMKAPQIVLWGLLLFQRHPQREGTGGRVFGGYGYRQLGAVIAGISGLDD